MVAVAVRARVRYCECDLAVGETETLDLLALPTYLLSGVVQYSRVEYGWQSGGQ